MFITVWQLGGKTIRVRPKKDRDSGAQNHVSMDRSSKASRGNENFDLQLESFHHVVHIYISRYTIQTALHYFLSHYTVTSEFTAIMVDTVEDICQEKQLHESQMVSSLVAEKTKITTAK